MTDEFRIAGYDPEGINGAGLISVGDGSNGNPLTFSFVADDDGVYRGYGLPPLDQDGDSDITQTLSCITEDVIRKHPDKWLWMYKRWKYIPTGAAQDSYPFYARNIERK